MSHEGIPPADITSVEAVLVSSSANSRGLAASEELTPKKRECGDGIDVHPVIEKRLPPEVDQSTETTRNCVTLRHNSNLTSKTKSDTSRHTLHFGSTDVSKVAVSELREIDEYKKSLNDRGSLPTKQLSELAATEFCHHTKEDLVQIIAAQKTKLQEKDSYISDLQSYIDNLLVKVIEIQPKLLLTATDETDETSKKLSSEQFSVKQPMATAPKNAAPLPSQTVQGPYVKYNSEQGTTVRASNVTVVPALNQKKNAVGTAKVTSTKKSINPFKALQAALK